MKSGRQDEDEADDRRGWIRDHGHRDRRGMCSNRVGSASVAWKLGEHVVWETMFQSSSPGKKKGFGQWVSACIHQRLARLARGWERDFLGTVVRSRARARCVRHFTRTHSNWRRDTRPCHPRTSFPLGTLYIRALCGRFTPSAMRPPSRHSSMVHAPRVSPLHPSIASTLRRIPLARGRAGESLLSHQDYQAFRRDAFSFQVFAFLVLRDMF